MLSAGRDPSTEVSDRNNHLDVVFTDDFFVGRFVQYPQRRGQLRRHQVDSAQLPERSVAALRSVPAGHYSRRTIQSRFTQ